jgi:hypothetical protein
MPWTTLRAEGSALPEGRGGHAVAVLDTATQQHLYVFGGADRSPCAFADLWRLTLSGACGIATASVRVQRSVRERRLGSLYTPPAGGASVSPSLLRVQWGRDVAALTVACCAGRTGGACEWRQEKPTLPDGASVAGECTR